MNNEILDEQLQQEEEQSQEQLPASTDSAGTTETNAVNVEDVIGNMSEEDIDKFDTVEDFLSQHNPVQDVVASHTVQNEPEVKEEVSNPSSETDSNADGSTNSLTSLSDDEFRALVTSSFKANHKDFQVEDPNEIRKLMQFGLNYHKKMGELAPHRKALKTLEQHGLLSPEKLNYAIELLQGNKGAIAQLLKEHSVDTYELPDLEEQPYKSGDYLPSDARIKFDEQVDNLRGSQSGDKTISFVNSLDSDSFYEVYNNPDMMNMIQEHVDNGLFGDATTLLEKERALGKVPANIKDIDAYAFVASELQKANPDKYRPNYQPQQKVVVGNNLNQTTVKPENQTTVSKRSAGIPNNSVGSRQETYSGVDLLVNATDEELAKYDSWEQYLASNKLNF